MQMIDQLQSCSSVLAKRGLKPITALAANRDHGDRLRYLAGCRCPACRAANSQYERSRQIARRNGEGNGIVSAQKARAHLLALAEEGIGRRSVAAATDITQSTIAAIRSGEKPNIRERTERLILAVTPMIAGDRMLIDGGPSHKLLAELMSAGFSKKQIALELGNNDSVPQIGRRERVTVRSAHLIRLAHDRLMKQVEDMKTKENIVYVPSDSSLRLISALRAEWFTDKQIARHLNITPEELSGVGRTVTVDFARNVQQVHERLMQ